MSEPGVEVGHNDRVQPLTASDPGEITLANWQSEASVAWSFQHLDELIPTASIPASGTPSILESVPTPVGHIPVTASDGWQGTVADVMATTFTDGWALWRQGALIAEEYPAGMAPHTRHLLMSVSKSLMGMVVGELIERSVLDPASPVEYVIPQLAGTGYAGATVRDVLDMRTGIGFSETYLDPHAEVRLMEQAIGWAPRVDVGVADTLYGFLADLRAVRPHGGAFEYRSCETNLLGWLCEAATGIPTARLISELLWAPMGAEFDAYVGVDTVGSAVVDGGVCATVRDLIRFGVLLLKGGVSDFGAQVVPASWIEDTWTGGADSVEAFSGSPTVTLMPGGMYRNQCWFPHAERDVLLCLGIHGQMVYVNRRTGLVAAKVSSWPQPQDAWKLFTTVAAFDAIGADM